MPRSGNLFLRSLRTLACHGSGTRDSACVIPYDYVPTEAAVAKSQYQLRVPYFVVDKLQNKCLFEWPRLVYLAVG